MENEEKKKYDGPKLIKKGVNRWVVVYANELHNPIMFESEEYKFHKARRVFRMKLIVYQNLLLRAYMKEVFRGDDYIVGDNANYHTRDKERLILSGGKQ